MDLFTDRYRGFRISDIIILTCILIAAVYCTVALIRIDTVKQNAVLQAVNYYDTNFNCEPVVAYSGAYLDNQSPLNFILDQKNSPSLR